MRTHDRLDKAISRACGRYFAPLYFCAGNGGRLRIEAVKRNAETEEFNALSGAVTARLVEFVVSRSTFDRMSVIVGGAGFDLFRGASIEERVGKETRTYAVQTSNPYDENSPDSGTVRIFTTLKKVK